MSLRRFGFYFHEETDHPMVYFMVDYASHTVTYHIDWYEMPDEVYTHWHRLLSETNEIATELLEDWYWDYREIETTEALDNFLRRYTNIELVFK